MFIVQNLSVGPAQQGFGFDLITLKWFSASPDHRRCGLARPCCAPSLCPGCGAHPQARWPVQYHSDPHSHPCSTFPNPNTPLRCRRAPKLKMDAFLLLALFCYILNHLQSSGIALTGRLGQIMALFLCGCCALLLNGLVQLQYHRLITVCIVHWHMFSLTSSWLAFEKSPHLLLCPLSLSLWHTSPYECVGLSLTSPPDLWQRGFRCRECDNPTAAQQRRGVGGKGFCPQQKGLRQLKRVMQQQYGRRHR